MEKVTRIVVMAKQVPDTRNVGKDAMTPEGTVNRAALAAIFNPEDLNALEMALQMKDRIGNATVQVLTMGPQRAADVIREAMFRGADGGYLLSGKEFAGSDTLATSYALSCALRKINPDIILVRNEDKEAFLSRYPYTLLDAVKNGRVYGIESGWIDVVSLRNMDAVDYIAEICGNAETRRN